MAQDKLTMKLLINGPSKKVLYAEAGKEVVDFLLSLLLLPLGTIIKLLSKDRMVGSLGGLYQSLEGLEDTYLQSNLTKTSLLSPMVSPSPLPTTLFLPAAPTAAKRYYRCSQQLSTDCRNYVAEVSGTPCVYCRNGMSTKMTFVDPKANGTVASTDGGGVGYVKGVVTYTIMDDLTINAMSSISCITLLNKFQVKDLGSLQEKTVTLGLDEGLELLKASLQSKTVLTDTFLRKQTKV